MARKITAAEDAAGEIPTAPEQPTEPAVTTASEEVATAAGSSGADAVTFIKNRHTSEALPLSDGTFFTFSGTSHVTSDPKLIAELAELAKTNNHGILIA